MEYLMPDADRLSEIVPMLFSEGCDVVGLRTSLQKKNSTLPFISTMTTTSRHFVTAILDLLLAPEAHFQCCRSIWSTKKNNLVS